MTSYFDAIPLGETAEIGSYRFTSQAIVDFASKYDPQLFHLDESAAKASLLGGLCASGWHTAAVFMRLNVRHIEASIARWVEVGNPAPRIGPSPGFRAMRWSAPVLAGRTIRFVQTVRSKRASASRPGWGLVAAANEGFDEDGRRLFALESVGFIGLE